MSCRTLWNLVRVSIPFIKNDMRRNHIFLFSCEKASACDSNPCFQGVCQNKNDNEYQCICKPGFTGTTCNASYDTCASNPCKCFDNDSVRLIIGNDFV